MGRRQHRRCAQPLERTGVLCIAVLALSFAGLGLGGTFVSNHRAAELRCLQILETTSRCFTLLTSALSFLT